MLFILQETDATHINLFIALHLILHVRAAQTQKTPSEKIQLKMHVEFFYLLEIMVTCILVSGEEDIGSRP